MLVVEILALVVVAVAGGFACRQLWRQRRRPKAPGSPSAGLVPGPDDAGVHLDGGPPTSV